ncbi:MAG: hypothetical protein IH859_04570, partial [Chloroflexi bacterium]|nr:hypothetical protein [Chloroflexota bacterium]
SAPTEIPGEDADDGGEVEEEQPSQPAAAERQAITFETMDGRMLEGFYYPSRIENAPVVVLMHWAPGTMADWSEIALWLQNRRDELASGRDELDAMVSHSAGQNEPWLDASWFPVLPPETSFAVLIFNFGGRGNSQEGPGRDGLYYDALAVVAAASMLEGVDRERITTMGASIGSDGAVDGCQAFNASDEYEGTCLGAFSLSPGSYLGRDYGETVNLLRQEDPPKTVFCLAAASDGNSLNTCLSAMGDHFESTGYEGSAHGMDLIAPKFSPNPLVRLLEFFQVVYGMATLIGP